MEKADLFLRDSRNLAARNAIPRRSSEGASLVRSEGFMKPGSECLREGTK